MKISRGIIEDGVLIGNIYNKYNSRNPFVRLIMKRFEKTLTFLIDKVGPSDIHEVGCGEGYWVINLNKQGIMVKGSDVSSKAIEIAKDNAEEQAVPNNIFIKKSIYDLSFALDSAELIICCEVLEHLEEPEYALTVLSKTTNPYLILSVPREPVWSLLNILRGRYLSNFGNTPGHIQRWSKSGFINLVSNYFKVLAVRTPLPWTMLLCRRKDS